MDRDEVNKAIEELPICSEGRGKVRNLLRALGFETAPEGKVGQVWKHYDSILLICVNNNVLYPIQIEDPYPGPYNDVATFDQYTYVAPDLETYFKMKERGEV